MVKKLKTPFYQKSKKNASSHPRGASTFQISGGQSTLTKSKCHARVADYERTMKVVVGVKFATKIASLSTHGFS